MHEYRHAMLMLEPDPRSAALMECRRLFFLKYRLWVVFCVHNGLRKNEKCPHVFVKAL